MPDWRAMVGPTEEAEAKMKRSEQAITEKVEQNEENTWGSLCQISHEVALQMLGERQKKNVKPWLTDRNEDIRRMDEEISKA